jgi:pimeloyl-ACP methyl ester carboxylesterase
MNVVIIPGFTGFPEEKTFEDLEKRLTAQGHSVIKIAWPHFPGDLDKYSLTETIYYSTSIIEKLDSDKTIILGFSMGAIIACYLAEKFTPKKLGLIVAPYQAGSEDDLSGKYKDWEESGYRDLTSSKYGKLRIPFSFLDDARRYNALDVICNVRCPILFIVGGKDDKVPTMATKRLFNKAKQPKEWHEISGMEHKYQYQPEKLYEVNKLIFDFVNK